MPRKALATARAALRFAQQATRGCGAQNTGPARQGASSLQARACPCRRPLCSAKPENPWVFERAR
jgi:hypothetical protein